MKVAVFDCETTGTVSKQVWLAHPRQPRLVQLSMRREQDEALVSEFTHIVKPDGWKIPPKYEQIHGISTMRALQEGLPAPQIWQMYVEVYTWADVLVAHNISYDLDIMSVFCARLKAKSLRTDNKKFICTMRLARELGLKPVNLKDVHIQLFGREHEGQHTANGDRQACRDIFYELVRRSPATQAYLSGRDRPQETTALTLG